MNWRIGQLQSQHEACLAIVEDIQARSAHIADRPSAVEITLMLARLTGILRIHLALEDEILYPALRNAKDPKIATAAEHYWREMGGLADTFLDFVDRWKRADMLLTEAERFRSESAAVFKALADRIGREHDEIYPMAERLRAARAA
ncbi:hemerythrin domain-containing protein [Sphingomonas sp. 35-24ZXX]|jgi:hemerythrin-like domain-containing protein|uniref:hemerythrin domain-containing protein n=1 Tax=Sphingomonas sp. 35-24ZXX TaxID=1545915 RepID=UPI0009E03219|nr:hemerythrin domain-containing protein [Sphingomonas sp. 35-24ZXX]